MSTAKPDEPALVKRMRRESKEQRTGGGYSGVERDQALAWLDSRPAPSEPDAWRSIPPHEMVLHCPNCGKQHLDIGEFATRVHRKHLCENTTEGPNTGCGHLWVPFPYATRGVAVVRTPLMTRLLAAIDRVPVFKPSDGLAGISCIACGSAGSELCASDCWVAELHAAADELDISGTAEAPSEPKVATAEMVESVAQAIWRSSDFVPFELAGAEETDPILQCHRRGALAKAGAALVALGYEVTQ